MLEGTSRCDILYFLVREIVIIFIREKSGNFEKRCLWRPCLDNELLFAEVNNK